MSHMLKQGTHDENHLISENLTYKFSKFMRKSLNRYRHELRHHLNLMFKTTSSEIGELPLKGLLISNSNRYIPLKL